MKIPKTTDVVFVDTLRIEANLGEDCWGRARSQPVEITVYLHLKQSYLQKAGESDNVLDSVHYGHLTKDISRLIRSKNESADPCFNGPDDLIHAVTEKAFALAGAAAEEVRVVLNVPKMVLLASGFSIDVTTISEPSVMVVEKKVLVTDIIIPVIIGVNAPERESKQRVVVNLTFYEEVGKHPAISYRDVVSKIANEIEKTSYLTLEKFALDVVRSACLSSENVAAATARAQKPSALSFAQSSGVELTRTRANFTQ